jgi:colanic acid/amylovoran biosynthesis glycosyltransferase
VRIVYVTQRLPFGDGETFVVPEIEALLGAGHEVLIILRHASAPVLPNDARALLSRTHVLPGPLAIVGAVAAGLVRSPARPAGAFWAIRGTRPRRRALANARAIVEGIWVARLARRRWRVDHIHAHRAHLTATLAMGASRVAGIPWSFTAHRYDVILNNLLAQKLRSARFGRFIAREMLAVAGRLVSPDALQRATVVHMGIPIPSLPTHGDRDTVARIPVILCPARLVAVKGHDILLEAAGRLRERGIAFELWIAGLGPECDRIRRRIAALGLEQQVRMLGTVPHDELMQLYREQRPDCVVLPSLDLGCRPHEGLSVALIEAMAHGLPVIGIRTGRIPELLAGPAGILVDPSDADGLADALAMVLGSPALRSKLGAAGRRRVEEDFDVATISRTLASWLAGGPTPWAV